MVSWLLRPRSSSCAVNGKSRVQLWRKTCTRAATDVKGFSKLEVALLTEEIVGELCYVRPGLIELSLGDTVVDVGANVGVFGQQAATIVGDTGSILSIEALPPTFSKLQENRDALQHDTSLYGWTLVNAAVGDTDTGTTEMTFYPRAAGWGTSTPQQHMQLMQNDLKQVVRNILEENTSQVLRSVLGRFASLLQAVLPQLFEAALDLYVRFLGSGGQKHHVPSRTLSSLLKEHNLGTVKLLKVDVEGAEVQVLQGLDDHAWGTVQQAVVEAHSDALVATVATILRSHYDTVTVEQSTRTQGTQLHVVYATEPRPRAVTAEDSDL